mmetsp:Transcript_25010/g.32299  ORF Transcript_25010/g.32299 Transcript_25010/m.32299 type:complete len:377 (-) Transcript_25010:213-1343(-)
MKSQEFVPILPEKVEITYSSSTDSISPSYNIHGQNNHRLSKRKRNVIKRCVHICPSAHYLKGLGLLGIVTLFFASYSPSIRAMFTLIQDTPPVLAWNAGVAVLGFISSIIHRPFITNSKQISRTEHIAGVELGIWSFLGATFNCIGLSLTTADQGAFCVQTTTVIVPLLQGVMGLPVSGFVWTGCFLSLVGAYALIMDSASGSTSDDRGKTLQVMIVGDLLCVGAALCYSLFDIRVNMYGKSCEFFNLAYTKMAWYAFLSVIAVFVPMVYDYNNYIVKLGNFIFMADAETYQVVFGVMIYQGIAIQFLATLILIPGQDIVGAARAQIIYAMAPLLTSLISWPFLGEKLGVIGIFGATIFMCALIVALKNPPDQNGH